MILSPNSIIQKIQNIVTGVLIIIVIGIAFFIRLPLLGGSFWLDEAAQALEVTRPWYQQLEIARDFQPPLLHILLHAAQYLSTSEWWLRMVGAVIPGLLSIGFAMGVIKHIAGNTKALWLGLLMATSSLHVFFSQELRPYALPAAVASISWWMLLKLLKTQPKTKVRVKTAMYFGVITGLGLYSSYLYPFLILGHIAFVWWYTQNKATLFSYLFTPLLIAALLFAPWIPSFIEQLQVGSELRVAVPGWDQVVSTPQWKALALVPGKFIFGVMSLQPQSVVGLSLGSALIASFLMARFICKHPFASAYMARFVPFYNIYRKSKSGYSKIKQLFEVVTATSKYSTRYSTNHNTGTHTSIPLKDRTHVLLVLAIAWFVVPFATSWFISWLVPVVSPKRLLFALPGFYLLLLSAPTLWRFPKATQKIITQWIVVILLIINVATLSLYWTNPLYQREDWRSLEQNIVADFPVDQTFLVFGFTGPFSPWAWYDSQDIAYAAPGYLTTEAAHETLSQKLKPATEYRYVLVFDYLRDLTDPTNAIPNQLEAFGFTEVGVLDYPNIGFIRIFTRPNTIIGTEI